MGFRDFLDNVQFGLEDAKDKLVEIKDDLVDGAEDITDNVKDALKDAREKLEEKKDDLVYNAEEFVNEPKEGIVNILEDMREKVVTGGTPFKTPASIIAGHIGNPLHGPASELIGTFLKKKVMPEPGCIVICKIAGGFAEHSGVYIGDDTIVELNGSGDIQEVSFHEFLNDGLTRTGIKIYVACDSSNNVLSDSLIESVQKTW